MKKNLKEAPAWADEIEAVGLKEALMDRLRFHGGMSLYFATSFAGCAQSTAKKHLNSFVEAGTATVQFLGDDWHYRHKPAH